MTLARLRPLAFRLLDPARWLGPLADAVEVRETPPEERPWEIYLGHLLGADRTRERRTVVAWRLETRSADGGAARTAEAAVDSDGTLDADGTATVPPVEIVWDASEGEVCVVRRLQVRAWTAEQDASGAIVSRPSLVWRSELTGRVELERAGDDDELAAQLERLVELAVVGVSRLPVTSLESPLVEFSHGRLAYLPVAGPVAGGSNSAVWREALERAERASSVERAARALEFALRAVPRAATAELVERLASGRTPERTEARLRRMFQQISLAPHTDLLEKTADLLEALAAPDRGPAWASLAIDTTSYMLRHLVRHLTAYDLVTFHSYGANYPDALWLDRLERLYAGMIAGRPGWFGDDGAEADRSSDGEGLRRRRRRAVRQAWLVRRRYAGHRVPARPTSMGEQWRAAGDSDQPLEPSQLADPAFRTRRLFDEGIACDDERLASAAYLRTLDASFADLADDDELRELGIGAFVDRPFGLFKDPGEVDRTSLLGYEAFSRTRAIERIELAAEAGRLERRAVRECAERLERWAAVGRAASELPGESRPGVIMLEDARRAADDFRFTATTRSSLAELAELPRGLTSDQRRTLLDWSRLPTRPLLIRTAGPRDAARGRPLLTRFDADGRPLDAVYVVPPDDQTPVYREAFGVEYLAAGVRIERWR